MPYFDLEPSPPELKLTIREEDLIVTHNAGFFSCSSVALFNIISYFNQFKKLPKTLDRTTQYYFYKKKYI